MASIFSRIVSGEIPCYRIAENDDFLAFLDINPLAKGHTLVVPKKEIDYIFSIDDGLYKDLFLFAKKVALAVEKVVPCQRIGIAVLGLEVAHAHIHVVPINTVYDIDFRKEKLHLTKEELTALQEKISREFAQMNQ